MTYRMVAAGLLLILGVGTAGAQSLAELARQEEARRKAIKTPAKVYTNEDIRGGRVPAPPTAASPGAPSTGTPPLSPPVPGTTAAAPATAAASPGSAGPELEKNEQYWRKRIQAARDVLARAEIFAEALQSRINALTADFVARDDPAQRAVLATDRQKALAELDRVKQEIAQQTKDVAAIQEEARRAGVPPGWLR